MAFSLSIVCNVFKTLLFKLQLKLIIAVLKFIIIVHYKLLPKEPLLPATSNSEFGWVNWNKYSYLVNTTQVNSFWRELIG